MPNITIRAAAEGMPTLKRRRMMINLTGAGLALATVGAAGKAPTAQVDSTRQATEDVARSARRDQ
ncbi:MULTISPECIES: hypothetical protein [unclassified Mesorhizobium]|uniref:hypothetical protein n=1 Tax=Mesorhizobium TaxID=68287 RepID=UPI0003CF117D|nr:MULTISPECIES: hypothetical protein [unclassified Mesorhizobium]ESY91330.1 hypothetical protein X741_23855 [Mesorhizobium sp. LNHC229A00]ESY95909.1 hypothetical protein X738_20980 [Mesorhizobium sp. LNHC209A00]